jgi:hypothetical protein
MADNNKHHNKHSENNISVEDVPQPLDKDYAHYPPTTTEQVIKPLTKELKKSEEPNTGNNIGTGKSNAASPQQQSNGIESKGEKIVNDSKKIVNSTDESYSDGSGGAFEATEQVND